MKQSMEKTIQQYIETWNLKDANDVKAGFEKCLSASCTYTDKNITTIAGPQSFADLAMKSHGLNPGRIFSQITGPEYFSNRGRYFWRVSFPNEAARDCMDYFEFDDAYMITAIVGFV